jgi:CubicO group peptidase (beta-lactamase class C family)
MRKILILIFAILHLCPVLRAQIKAEVKADSIDVFLKAQMQKRHIPGMQLAIIRDGKVIKSANYGLANVEHDVPVTDQTVFNINSITKAFIGVAAVQLVEQGKLTIDAPLSKYLDSLPVLWQGVTIGQLMSHNSGLPDVPDDLDNMGGNGSLAAAMKLTASLPIHFKPGTAFEYNQMNYILLGLIIQKLSGLSFQEFVQKKQLDKVGITQTTFGDSFDLIAHYAGIYTNMKLVEGKWIRTNTLGVGYLKIPEWYRTATGMVSSAGELAKWLIALQQGQLISKENLSLLWRPSVLSNGQPGGFDPFINGYALGWPVVIRAEHPAIAPIGGGRAALFMYPKDNLSILVLTNKQGCSPESFIDEIAGYYFPEMHAVNGFGLSAELQTIRKALLRKGFSHAREIVASAQKKNPRLILSENEINGWGYTLLNNGQIKQAIDIFKWNTSLFPASYNTYDSLGEAYQANGQKELAIENFKRSLELNAQNKNAAERLKLLQNN